MALLVVLVGWVVYRALDAKGQLTAAKWDPFLQATLWTTYLIPGINGTLTAAALSIVLALILGAALGIGRMSDHRWVRAISGFIVELFRAIPVLILMIFAYQVFAEYQVFKSRYLALAAVVTALTLYNGSVIAEIGRAGIRSLPKGQTEAAQSLGMRKASDDAHDPASAGGDRDAAGDRGAEMVVALKDSALGYLITYVEIVRSGTATRRVLRQLPARADRGGADHDRADLDPDPVRHLARAAVACRPIA